MSDKKNNSKRILVDIVSLLIIGWGIIMFLAFISFDPNDSYFFTTSPNRPVKNMTGIIGSFISSILLIAFGKPAFIISIMLFLIGWYMLIKKTKSDIIIINLGFFFLMLTLSIILSIQTIKGGNANFIKKGGAVGLFLANLLKEYFGTTGLYIICLLFGILSLTLITNFSLSSIAQFIKDIILGITKIKNFFFNMFKPEIVEHNDVRKPPLITKVDLNNENQKIEIEEEKFSVQKPEPILLETPQPNEEKLILNSKKEIESFKKDFKSKIFKYQFPPLDFLLKSPEFDYKSIEKETYETARLLEATLKEFGITAKVINIQRGPVITRYELQPAPGVKISKIVGLADNIALSLAAPKVRIVAPIPGKAAVGVEIPNKIRSMVTLGDVLTLPDFRKNYKPLEIVLGKDITGNPVKIDLKECPHLLIAGSTGSGKSVCLHSIITTFIYNISPKELRFIMIDPKMVELKFYNGIPHLLTEVITNPKDAVLALKYLVNEMQRRYYLLDQFGARDIEKYNEKIEKKIKKSEEAEYLPYIVTIIDEFADLMMMVAKEIEELIVRLAQKARAVGIHLILATQRPSVDVITGIIKANFPSRIAFQVASKIDSRTILDVTGAEKLLGKGDMLLSYSGRPNLIRLQGAFISEDEIEKIVDFIVENSLPNDYINLSEISKLNEEAQSEDEFYDEDDPLYEKAKEIVKETKKASASYLQRRLKIGFNRAARIIDRMEKEGLISPPDGSKPREVYIEKFK